MSLRPDRRSLLLRTAALAGTGMLAGCDRLSNAAWFRRTLKAGEDANLFAQRLLLSPEQLAPEYAEADLSPRFKPNGSTAPTDKSYLTMAKRDFADFKLEVGGLVETPVKLSLGDLRKMPVRTQITRHDCVEGWSCIGKWTGVPLSQILNKVGLKPQARFVVFHCADVMEGRGTAGQDEAGDTDRPDPQPRQQGRSASVGGGSGQTGTGQSGDAGDDAADDDDTPPVFFYGSIDLNDAMHPQTILAYEMNDKPLPVAYGAPLRLRVERQLGYKMSKFVTRIEVVDDFSKFGQGKGGYWEDHGYEWYAGI